ncbi:P-loop NTPase fold protein [Paraburkholderia mimosarum]|uniref:KAP family P-loop NTPase fold protein n=1 Tax=Paraburkholderia mimosarum TaxID=312026 RepID=UPI0039C054F6
MNDTATETASNEIVILTAGSEPVADAIFLPTDISGTPGQLNSRILSTLGIDLSVIPRAEKLSDGYAIVTAERRRICFVVTVDSADTASLLRTHFERALRDERLANAKSLWIPLMGTGSGGLRLDESRLIEMEVLSRTGWIRRPDVQITIAFPPRSLVDESDFPEFALEPSVRAALEYAAVLRLGLTQRDTEISTTILFLALAGSQRGDAPIALQQDETASLFSGAVRSLSGHRFVAAWTQSFPLQSDGRTMPQSWPASLTPNTLAIFKAAVGMAQRVGRKSINIDDVIESFLAHPASRKVLSLADFGIQSDALLREYQDARVGQIGKMLHNDVATVQDRLGYDAYAEAIRDFLVDKATPWPLSVSIQAPWGTGKSSLMRQIREQLDPVDDRTEHAATPSKGRLTLSGVLAFLNQKQPAFKPGESNDKQLWTVWFNAWQYDSSEKLWAGLVDAIVAQVTARLNPFDRELFLLRLQLSRIDDSIVRRKIYDRVTTIWWSKARSWTLAGATGIGSMFAAHAASDHTQSSWISGALAHTPLAGLIGGVGLAVALAISYGKTRANTNAEPAAFALSEYLQVPDYNRELGTIHHVHRDLLRVLELVPRQRDSGEPSPLVVFIDDLDRCSPSKIAGVVEGVNMFLASEAYRCMFVIGIDPQMIAAALEEAHSKVRERLPIYERRAPLGWRFMDKFIQLPFTIPPCAGERLNSYVESLTEHRFATKMATSPGQPSANSSDSPIAEQSPDDDQPRVTEAEDISPGVPSDEIPTQSDSTQFNEEVLSTTESVKEFRESRDVGALIRLAAKDISNNPREIKRMANLARLYLGLRNSRRARDPSWRSPNLDQYARWIVVTLRWPDMLRWLLWGADEGIWSRDAASLGLSERRLRFLQWEAAKVSSVGEWVSALLAHLGALDTQSVGWVSDPGLFAFFKAEAGMPAEERLSAAIANGFW